MDGNDTLKEFHIFNTNYSLPLENSPSKTKDNILMVSTIMFSQKGYSAVSVRDIAAALNIKPASLYNHFDSKETLWRAVLDHTKELYLLFFQHLESQTEKATSFEEVLDILFREPQKMDNVFTCYAFALIQTEQFQSEYAGQVFTEVFLEYAISFVQQRLDDCVAKGFVKPFDTYATAIIYTHTILVAIAVSVQKLLGRPAAYDPGAMVSHMHRYILQVTGRAPAQQNPGE